MRPAEHFPRAPCRLTIRRSTPALFRKAQSRPVRGPDTRGEIRAIGGGKRTTVYDLALTPERAHALGGRIWNQFRVLSEQDFGETSPTEIFCHLPKNYRNALAEQLALLGQFALVDYAERRLGEKLCQLKMWLETKRYVRT